MRRFFSCSAIAISPCCWKQRSITHVWCWCYLYPYFCEYLFRNKITVAHRDLFVFYNIDLCFLLLPTRFLTDFEFRPTASIKMVVVVISLALSCRSLRTFHFARKSNSYMESNLVLCTKRDCAKMSSAEDAVFTGHDVLILGTAGTGKRFLVKKPFQN